MANSKPFISVIIPSRNRPGLLRRAVDSIRAQSFDAYEIIIVNDGSDEAAAADYRRLAEEHVDRLRLIDLVNYPRGHGPSYVINQGAANARGDVIAFLDDDDEWTDRDHLRKVNDAFQEHASADLYFTNQLAVKDGETNGEVLWLGNLHSVVQKAGIECQHGLYRVGVEELLAAGGFAHLNTTVVRRELFEKIGGLDENIRWEGDRDFFLRLIDQSAMTLFNPDVVALHHVPNQAKTDNITTATSFYTRMFSQLDVLNKAILSGRHPLIRAHARQHKVYTIKRIAEQLASEHRHADALYFSSQALFMEGSWKWLLRHLWLWVRKLSAR